MLGRYYSLVQRLPIAAVVLTPAGRLTANPAASYAVAGHAPQERLRELCLATIADGRLRTETIGGLHFSIAPLFDERMGVEAALGVASPPDELPRLLHLFQEPLRSFGRIVHELPMPVGTARPDGRFDFFNQRWSEEFDVPRSTPPDERFALAFAGEDRSTGLAAWRSGIAQGSAFGFRARMRSNRGERWFHADARPMTESGRPIKWVVTMTDVHDETIAYDIVRRSEDDLRTIAVASSAFERAATHADLQEAVRLIGRPRGEVWEFAFADDTVELRADAYEIRLPVGPSDVRAFLRVYRTSGEGLQEGTSKLTGEIGLRLGYVLERVASAERERRLAHTLQRSMLPDELPSEDGLRCGVAYAAASNDMFVGGDWYDVFRLGDGRIAFTIGDVTGHGIEAAISMGTIRQLLRAAAHENDDPATVLSRVNHALFLEQKVASAIFGTIDPLTGDVHFANAGHPPPYLVAPDGACTPLSGDGLLLGVRDTAPSPVRSIVVEPGEALMLYTDGLIEATHDVLGMTERVCRTLTQWAVNRFEADAAMLHQAIIGDDAAQDDIAILLLRFEPLARLDATVQATPRNASRLRHAVERIIGVIEPNPDRAYEITLAIAEAVNNASEHAYRGKAGPVRLTIRMHEDTLEATVRDQGAWHNVPSPNRGRGWQIIRELVPQAEVATGDDGTTVSLSCTLTTARVPLETTVSSAPVRGLRRTPR